MINPGTEESHDEINKQEDTFNNVEKASNFEKERRSSKCKHCGRLTYAADKVCLSCISKK